MNLVKSHRDRFAKCYIVALSIIALMSKRMLIPSLSLTYNEFFPVFKMIPWNLLPMLVCALVGAYLTDKGYGRTVGICGALILLATTIVQGGCFVWMDALDGTDNLREIELNGYRIRLPLALFLINSSFMRGGGIAILINVVSGIRTSDNMVWESHLLSSVAILTSLFALNIWAKQCEWSWIACAYIGFAYMLLLIPVLLYFLHLNEDEKKEANPNVSGDASESRTRSSLLSWMIFTIVATTICAFWRYIPTYWFDTVFFRLEAVVPLSVSSFSLAVSLLVMGLRKKRKGGLGRHSIQIGSILLLVGFPLAAMLTVPEILKFVPQMIIGLGLASVFSATLPALVTIPAKLPALAWVGTCAVICLFYRLLVIVLNRMSLLLLTRGMAVYVIFPMIALILIILSDLKEK